jgi:hypothetical protein
MFKTAKQLLEFLQLLDAQGHDLDAVSIEIGGDTSAPLGCVCLDGSTSIITLVREGE